jgi:hypothetical protein
VAVLRRDQPYTRASANASVDRVPSSDVLLATSRAPSEWRGVGRHRARR